jgi:hypothetical protein
MEKVLICLIRVANRIWPKFTFNIVRMVMLAGRAPKRQRKTRSRTRASRHRWKLPPLLFRSLQKRA